MSSNDRLVNSKAEGSKPVPTSATPRLSASLLLLNEKNEVLMIQRTADSRTFAGMHAFPGGNYDAAHDGSNADLRTTAVRETFEETGILLASPELKLKSLPSPTGLARARQAIHSRTDPTTFPSFLATNGLTISPTIDRLIPFSQWVTPVSAKARFWTWFYIGFLEEMGGVLAAEDANVTDVSSDLVPTHDNHVEIQSAYFQSPRAILDSFNRGDISLMPPQFYLLTMLIDVLDQKALISSASSNGREKSTADYCREIMGRQFGARVFNPRFGGKVVGDDGVERSILMYEGDGKHNGKDGDGGKKHRSLLTFNDGRPNSIKIERNIDVLGVDSLRNLAGAVPKL